MYDPYLFAVYVGKYSTHPMNTGFPMDNANTSK